MEVNKDGEEASAKKTRRVSRIHSIASQRRAAGSSIREDGRVSRTTHTHHSECGLGRGDPKAKQGVLSFQFSFHFLYCYYSIEPAAGGRAGNISAALGAA